MASDTRILSLLFSRAPSFGVQVVIGLGAGIALGLIARTYGETSWLAATLAEIGSIFVQMLKTIVPPLIFAAIVASIANLGAVANAARLAWQTLLWFAITAGIAVVIGLALGLLLQPGLHSGVAASAARAPATIGGWTDFLKGLCLAIFSVSQHRRGSRVTALRTARLVSTSSNSSSSRSSSASLH